MCIVNDYDYWQKNKNGRSAEFNYKSGPGANIIPYKHNNIACVNESLVHFITLS